MKRGLTTIFPPFEGGTEGGRPYEGVIIKSLDNSIMEDSIFNNAMKYQHKILLELVDKVPVINIEGDLTSDADGEVKEIYSGIKTAHPSRKIIINFRKTQYVNSSGIAILIYIIQDAKKTGGAVAFVGMSAHLQKVMSIVGIADFIRLYDSNTEAIRNL
jgi:anti-sigma B factor antagonist